MNVDRRLHHAARELREVPIDVPLLDDLTHRSEPAGRPRPRPRPRLAALAAPMLFVAGGLLAVGVMQRSVEAPVHSDFGGGVVDATTTNGVGAAVPAPSVSDELQLIRGIVDSSPDAPVVDSVEPPATAPGPN